MKKVLSVALAGALITAAMAVPAVAKGPQKAKKGKKAIGTVVSFDAATGDLVAEMRNGATFNGEVSPDAKVKLEHRGKPAAKGNPTKGSLDDLVAGAKILKLKRRDGVIMRVQLRPAGSTVDDHPGNGGECKSSDDSEGADEAETDEGDAGEGEEVEALDSHEDTGDSSDTGDTTETDDSTEADPEDCIQGDGDGGSGDESETDEGDAAEGDDSAGDAEGDDGSGSEDAA